MLQEVLNLILIQTLEVIRAEQSVSLLDIAALVQRQTSFILGAMDPQALLEQFHLEMFLKQH